MPGSVGCHYQSLLKKNFHDCAAMTLQHCSFLSFIYTCKCN
jgi:hypothetical protein